VLVASAISTITCIIPAELSRANAEWVETRTPEAKATWQREVDRGVFREHVVMAAQLAVAFAIALGICNLFLPPRPPARGTPAGAMHLAVVPYSWRTILAGLPTTTRAGTSRTTRPRRLRRCHRQSRPPGHTITPPPSHTLFPIVMGREPSRFSRLASGSTGCVAVRSCTSSGVKEPDAKNDIEGDEREEPSVDPR